VPGQRLPRWQTGPGAGHQGLRADRMESPFLLRRPGRGLCGDRGFR